jgi:hypothetical protein
VKKFFQRRSKFLPNLWKKIKICGVPKELFIVT